MISILKYVMFQFVYLHIHACADLELLTQPVVFEENVRLACTANETEIPLDKPHSRSWSGGPFNKVLCINAVCTDLSKYDEVLGKDKSQYILVIKPFLEADVDCEYKCIVGVDETRKTLQLNEEDYEYIPSNETTTVNASLQHGHFSVNVHFAKVWPPPVCEIIFEKVNYGKLAKMAKKKNGKLYSVDISLNHTLRKEDCSGEMLISCRIGTKHIEVQRKQFNTCPIIVHSKDKKRPKRFCAFSTGISCFHDFSYGFCRDDFLDNEKNGYIKSISLLAYFEHHNETQYKHDPSLGETNVMLMHPQQEPR